MRTHFLVLTSLLLSSGLGLSFVQAAEVLPCESGTGILSELIPAGSTAPAHAAITHDLYNGEIIHIQPFSADSNAHNLYLVKIRGRDWNGKERIREAIFKPRVYGDEDGFGRNTMEFVGYDLNRKLGMDYVPPVSYRRGLDINIDGEHFSEGAFIFKAPEFKSLHALPRNHFPHEHDAIISDNRVLNVLMHNSDAHSKNLGMAKHWSDGKTRPIFLDFGASFRRGTYVAMDHYPAYENSSIVQKIRRVTYDHLKTLQLDSFRHLIDGHFLSAQEVRELLGRRDGIIHYFDQLAQEKGQAAVFLP